MTVVIPTRNGEPGIGTVLSALVRQVFPGPIELIVIDSGSDDGTLETAARHGARILHVEPDAFDHGDTRNLAIYHARAPFVAILSQDAEPVGLHWLRHLVQPLLDDERVSGVCCRVLPRPGMDPLLQRAVEQDLNFARERREMVIEDRETFAVLSPDEQRLALNFHDIGSCLRREVWERLPFPRTPFGEDLMWAKAVLEAGGKLVYEPLAEVLHAHDYTARSLYRRAWWDGWLNRRLLDRRPVRRARDILVHAWRGVLADRTYLARHGHSLTARLRALPRSVALQLGILSGFYRGARSTEYRPVTRAPVPARPLRVLLVVHGFPPQSLAGTEVYTLTVAKALRARGHHVAVFHRHADPQAPSYSVEAAEYDGLPAYRLVNNLRYLELEQSYENPHAEDSFHEILSRERPDVVHFQHCLHTSASLIGLCEDRGIPTVLTLNDFWFICPTVQLILPDRSLCRAKRAGLACVDCVPGDGPSAPFGRLTLRLLEALRRAAPGTYGRILELRPRLRQDALAARALSRRPAVNVAHMSRAGRVLSPSRFLREQYLEFGVDDELVIYQRYGIDTERLLGAGKTPRRGPLRVGFIGSFVWYKGLHVLIDAFREIAADRAELTVYGNPEEPPAVRPYAAECRQAAAGRPVRFAGALPQTELKDAHRQLDVLVVPSLWYENSPLVILEALAAGTPVITSDLGGMAELVQDGVSGRLFPRGDAAALRRCILELAEDPARVDAMARAIRPPKDVATNVAELELVYRQEISRVRPATARVPFWSSSGARYGAAAGQVEVQGEDLALLRPAPGGPSSVSYSVTLPRAGTVLFEVTTHLLAWEPTLELSGSLYVDGQLAGEIPPHRLADGAGSTRAHRFSQDCSGSTLTLTLRNGRPAEQTPRSFLRIQRVAAYLQDAS